MGRFAPAPQKKSYTVNFRISEDLWEYLEGIKNEYRLISAHDAARAIVLGSFTRDTTSEDAAK